MRYFLYCRKSQEDKNRQVLSLASQIDVATRKFGDDPNVSIVAVIEEARTAKVPGRPLLDDMLARIERGEADGIVSYAPDRLARNSVDGGRIVYLLDLGILKDLKFVSYTFENSPAGKMMLQIMFAQSKHFSDALSERIRIGIDKKIELGWRPNRPPEGYLNDREHRTITIDPERFPFIRLIFELFLGGMSPAAITRLAREEWGYLTRWGARSGGRPLALSTVYKILNNPFYPGIIEWKGERFVGKHPPLVTLDEFDAVQTRLHRRNAPRPKRHSFAFTGLMRCGVCGLMITAEQKVKPSGRSYTYYHCTKRGVGLRCSEPYVEQSALTEQIVEFLDTLAIPAPIEAWALDELALQQSDQAELAAATEEALCRALAEAKAQLAELTSLRLRRLLTDEEFIAERRRLEGEAMRLAARAADGGKNDRGFELARTAISMRNQAVEWFRTGGDAERRLIFETAGSNPTLIGGKLRVQAAKPFVAAPVLPVSLWLCRSVEDVGTCPVEMRLQVRRFMSGTFAALQDPSSATIVAHLKELGSRHQPRSEGEAGSLTSPGLTA